MGPASAPGTSKPGHPYHWKLVVFDNPLSPVTRPPEDMEKVYWPSSDLLMVMGKRLEMRRRRPEEPASSAMGGIMTVVCYVGMGIRGGEVTIRKSCERQKVFFAAVFFVMNVWEVSAGWIGRWCGDVLDQGKAWKPASSCTRRGREGAIGRAG